MQDRQQQQLQQQQQCESTLHSRLQEQSLGQLARKCSSSSLRDNLSSSENSISASVIDGRIRVRSKYVPKSSGKEIISLLISNYLMEQQQQ
ncbi:hypothetical protein M0802_006752 [Mischocyttarus mexicanus]|nr:hypothetical protein M0802_006752 [Mischocyttarus mexicanus]